MPYDPTNENEISTILVTDPEALEVIEQVKESRSRFFGREYTTEDTLEWWRSDPHVSYHLVEVRDGKATGDFDLGMFEALGKARAEAWNFCHEFRHYGKNTVEIRKRTGSKRNCSQAQKTGDTGPDGCWYSICLSIELVDTITM